MIDDKTYYLLFESLNQAPCAFGGIIFAPAHLELQGRRHRRQQTHVEVGTLANRAQYNSNAYDDNGREEIIDNQATNTFF